jgi:hydroxyacylglutathione hydrolase
MFSVYPIDILHVNDNYIWVITPHNSKNAYLVDPGDAEPARKWLQDHDRILAGMFVTHHHWDHVNGIPELHDEYPSIPVWGPRHPQIPGVTQVVGEGDNVTVEDLTFEVLAVPGHTHDHVAFYCAEAPEPALFCGDTMFASGCGRVFEGTPEELYKSLLRFTRLPPQTRVFCAHEYTLANLAFAKAVEPNNTEIDAQKSAVEHLRKQKQPSLPSTVGQELRTNPFLRTQVPEVVRAAQGRAPGLTASDAAEVFAVLRRWKDTFRLS